MDNWHFMDWSFRDKKSNTYIIVAYLSEDNNSSNDNSEMINDFKEELNAIHKSLK